MRVPPSSGYPARFDRNGFSLTSAGGNTARIGCTCTPAARWASTDRCQQGEGDPVWRQRQELQTGLHRAHSPPGILRRQKVIGLQSGGQLYLHAWQRSVDAQRAAGVQVHPMRAVFPPAEVSENPFLSNLAG